MKSAEVGKNVDFSLVNPELLKILCCPETHQALALAEPVLVQQLNEKIASNRLLNRAGKAVLDKMDGGLIRSDGKFLYPLRQNIPIMLIDEAIPLSP